MILNCPQCQTRYLVDPLALGPAGRTVRCARCHAEWKQRPPKDLPRRVDVASAEDPGTGGGQADGDGPDRDLASAIPPSMRRPSAYDAISARAPGAGPPKLPALPRQPSTLAPILWMAAAVFFVALVAAALFWRQDVVARWAPAARLYGLVGIDVVVPLNLEFRDLRYVREGEGGQATLRVTGQVYNGAPGSRLVPPVVVALLDGADRELTRQTSAATPGELAPGEAAAFDLVLPNPPAEAVKVSVTFAKAP